MKKEMKEDVELQEVNFFERWDDCRVGVCLRSGKMFSGVLANYPGFVKIRNNYKRPIKIRKASIVWLELHRKDEKWKKLLYPVREGDEG